MRTISIRAGGMSAVAHLLDNATADAVWENLPLTALGNRWGAEIYFEIPAHLDQSDDAREVMQPGELAYWPTGRAFCIFWGPTPVSQGDEPRAYSPVNPFGKIEGDATVFDDVPDGAEIHVERVE